MIRESPEEFEGQFGCLGKNKEKYISFSIPIKKKNTKLMKIEKKLQKT